MHSDVNNWNKIRKLEHEKNFRVRNITLEARPLRSTVLNRTKYRKSNLRSCWQCIGKQVLSEQSILL